MDRDDDDNHPNPLNQEGYHTFEPHGYTLIRRKFTQEDIDKANELAKEGKTKRGILVAIEGIDGVGKTTQVKAVAEHLRKVNGLPVEILAFPVRETPTGVMINEYLTNGDLDKASKSYKKMMQLLFSANRFEMNSYILAALYAGVNVILDRYSYSGMAYAAALGVYLLETLAKIELGLVCPDLVIYMRMDMQEASKRCAHRNSITQNVTTVPGSKDTVSAKKDLYDGKTAILKIVEECYDVMFDQAHFMCEPYVQSVHKIKIEAMATRESITENIVSAVVHRISVREFTPCAKFTLMYGLFFDT